MQIINDPWVTDSKPRECSFTDTMYSTKNKPESHGKIATAGGYKRSDKENARVQ